MVDQAFALLREVPDVPMIPQPGQGDLDQVVASILSAGAPVPAAA